MSLNFWAKLPLWLRPGDRSWAWFWAIGFGMLTPALLAAVGVVAMLHDRDEKYTVLEHSRKPVMVATLSEAINQERRGKGIPSSCGGYISSNVVGVIAPGYACGEELRVMLPQGEVTLPVVDTYGHYPKPVVPMMVLTKAAGALLGLTPDDKPVCALVNAEVQEQVDWRSPPSYAACERVQQQLLKAAEKLGGADVDLAAQNVLGEANHLITDEKRLPGRLVTQLVQNRVQIGYRGGSIAEVIRASGQYSWLEDGKPDPDASWEKWPLAQSIVLESILGVLHGEALDLAYLTRPWQDETGQWWCRTNYANERVHLQMGQKAPKWMYSADNFEGIRSVGWSDSLTYGHTVYELRCKNPYAEVEVRVATVTQN